MFVGEDEDNGNEASWIIVDAVVFAHGSAGIPEFLSEEVLVKRDGRESSMTVAAMLNKAQGRAHENIRKNMVSAFVIIAYTDNWERWI